MFSYRNRLDNKEKHLLFLNGLQKQFRNNAIVKNKKKALFFPSILYD